MKKIVLPLAGALLVVGGLTGAAFAFSGDRLPAPGGPAKGATQSPGADGVGLKPGMLMPAPGSDVPEMIVSDGCGDTSISVGMPVSGTDTPEMIVESGDAAAGSTVPVGSDILEGVPDEDLASMSGPVSSEMPVPGTDTKEMEVYPDPNCDEPLAEEPMPVPGADTEPREMVIVELAPIEDLAIHINKSLPAQYVVNVTFGLPNGCTRTGEYRVKRDGTHFDVVVENYRFGGPDAMCTMIYGTDSHSINLGSDFESGVTYTVNVNGKTTTFVAG